MRRLCLAVVAAVLPPPATAQGDLAITYVSVIDGGDSVPRPDQTVIVRGNRIVAVTAASAARIPAGARRVDGRGKFLLPGFWVMHVHTVIPEPRLALYVASR
jgi:imidazolonepropionase-like amidohydrolase